MMKMFRSAYLLGILVLLCLACSCFVAYKQVVSGRKSKEEVSPVNAELEADDFDLVMMEEKEPKEEKKQRRQHSKDAYVTLLYRGFLLGARVLGQSLRETGTKMDMVVLCAETVPKATKDILAADGWIIRPIENIPSPYQGLSKRADYFSGIFSKVYVWNMTEYERVVYLDSDVLVLENIDHMFDCGTFCATFRHSDLFNAGIMVVEPSRAIFKDMVDKIPLLPSYDFGDQGFLNAYFNYLVYAPYFNWSCSLRQHQPMRMPTELNADIAIYYISSYWSIKGDIKIIHYTLGPIKPWIWWTDRLFHLNSQWTRVRMRLPEYDGYNDKYEPFYLPIFWVPYPICALFLYILSTKCDRTLLFGRYPCNNYVIMLLKLFISRSTVFAHFLPIPILLCVYYLAFLFVPTTMLSIQAEYVFWLWSSLFLWLIMGTYCYFTSMLLDSHPSTIQQRKLFSSAMFAVFSLTHFMVAFLPRLAGPFRHRFLISLLSAAAHLMACQVVGLRVILAWTRPEKVQHLEECYEKH